MRMLDARSGLAQPAAAEHARLLAYLSNAAVVVAAAGTELDERDTSRGHVVPIGLVTDGTLIWPLHVRYYYATYGGGVPADVLLAARRNRFKVPEIPDTTLTAVRAFLRDRLASGSTADRVELASDPFA